MAPASSDATSATTRSSESGASERTEVAAGDGRNERHLVAVGERRIAIHVGAIDGVDEAPRLVAEPERGPDVVDARAVRELELALP